jgi:hypothetical protein
MVKNSGWTPGVQPEYVEECKVLEMVVGGRKMFDMAM